MGNIGWTELDEFERIGFKHETKEFLVRFSFKDNGFPIEAVVQEDFIRWQGLDVRVAKNETIVIDCPHSGCGEQRGGGC